MSSSDVSADAEIRVICGPTAAGKSAIALWLAELTPSTIISADSRQTYRRFDIGTAKPSAAEQGRVPHRGIDLVEPSARYSAAAWASSADRWIEEALVAKRVPLVVGGTGLYLRALFEGIFGEPPLDADRRAALEVALSRLTVPELRRWARALDPARAHLGRTQLLRVIEIALLTGRRLSDLHIERRASVRWRPRYLVVDPGPALADRITARTDAMLAGGWPEEVRALERDVPEDAPAWNATGYRQVRAYVRGECDLARTREAAVIGTRQYAKRQRTWFRHQLPAERVTRIDPLAENWRGSVERWAQLRGPR